MNHATSDPALMPLIERYMDAENRMILQPLLEKLGADLPDRLFDLADTADKNPPVLQQYNRAGDRVDEVQIHAAYADLNRIAYEEYGLSALSHRAIHGWSETPPHLVKYIMSYLFIQAEFGLGCPVNMTDAAARTLRKFGDPNVFQTYVDRLISTDPQERFTGAMFMTETQAGTDIAKTETRAVQDPDQDGVWRLTGRKWFTSNPTADVVLTLAKYPGGDDTTRGVGLFMLPRVTPSGERNSYTIDRLKDKFGTRSMPSGEITLDGAWALQVGELDRGFRQMAEMINTSRLSNAMRGSALMRRAVTESVDHTRNRVVFGRRLSDQPLMRMNLLDLQLQAEASLGMVFYAGDQLQRGDHGEERSANLIRVLTPIAKHYICKKARWVTGEAMEIRGGNGYIEDFPNARLVRDAHLGSIWEGASNVIALDVLRCLRKFGSHRIIADAMSEKLASLEGTDAAEGARHLLEVWQDLRRRGDVLLELDRDAAEAMIGRYTDAMAEAIMATLLQEQAEFEIRTHDRHRTLMVANTYVQRVVLGDDGAAPMALRWVDEILDGAAVDRDDAVDALGQRLPAGV
ncbi:MAG: acyl-CoA dehydrogenase family protein [Micrococcaceae bacterium]